MSMESLPGILSIVLALSVLLVIGVGLWSRVKTDKGIGWQFIRFNVICISIPIIGILALNGALAGDAATLIASAMAYAFGRSDGDR